LHTTLCRTTWCSPTAPHPNIERYPMKLRRLSVLAGLLASVVAVPAALAQAPSSSSPSPAGSPGTPTITAAPMPFVPDPVIEWNRTLLGIVRTMGVQPPTIHATRNFAILHLGIYDAVVAVDGGTPYLPEHILRRGASAAAAADQAA